AVLPGKPTQHHHAEQHPPRSARQSRNIVRSRDVSQRRERLIRPFGKRDSVGKSGRGRTRFKAGIVQAHKRPSTCGSGRLGSSCHVCLYLAKRGKRVREKFRAKSSETRIYR